MTHERNTDPIWTAVRWVDGRLQARHRNGKTEFVASTTYVLQQLSGWLVKHDGGQLNAERMSAEYGLAFPPGWVPGEGMPAKPAAPALPTGWVRVEMPSPAQRAARFTTGAIQTTVTVDAWVARVTYQVADLKDEIECPINILEALIAEQRADSGGEA